MSNPFADLTTLPVNYLELSSQYRRQVREEYIRRQKGMCSHCGETLAGPHADAIEKAWINERLFPIGFFNHPVHLHHSHQTGMTIGAVHARCNAYLWQYKGE